MTPGPLLVGRGQAARMLGMSLDYVERDVFGELRVVRCGRKVLVPVRELEKWVERNARRALEAEA